MPEPITGQEVLDHLSKRAEENGDNFRLKVLRRPNAASQQTTWIASFSDATWSMIANAESWLSSFAGGGLYVLHVYDGKTTKQLGVILPSELAGAPRQPDPRVTKTSSWLGPNLIDVPSIGPTNGAVAIGFHPLAGEPSPTAQPRSVHEAGLVGLFDKSKELDGHYRQREAELAERERRMAEDRARAEIEAERRARADAQRASDERMRTLEAKLERALEIAAKPPAVPQGPSVSEILTGLLGAIAPLATVWINASAQDRKERLEVERVRAERESKLLEEAGKRPLIDPAILDILGRQTAQSEASSKQLAEFMRAQADSSRVTLESQATAQRSMLQTIADVAQLQAKVGGGEEEKSVDWGKVALGIMQGLASMQARGGQPGQGMPPGAVPGTPQLAGAVPGTTPAPAPEIPVNPSEAFNEIEKMVKSKQPPSEVITKLKAALEDEPSKKEIAACGGLIEVFNERLGEWSQNEANAPYLEALQKELVTSGIFPASTFE